MWPENTDKKEFVWGNKIHCQSHNHWTILWSYGNQSRPRKTLKFWAWVWSSFLINSICCPIYFVKTQYPFVFYSAWATWGHRLPGFFFFLFVFVFVFFFNLEHWTVSDSEITQISVLVMFSPEKFDKNKQREPRVWAIYLLRFRTTSTIFERFWLLRTFSVKSNWHTAIFPIKCFFFP